MEDAKVKKIVQKFKQKLDKWFETQEHEYYCMGYSEVLKWLEKTLKSLK